MQNFLRFAIVLVFTISIQQMAYSQSVGINTTGAVADPSAILDVTSNSKGVLVTRMTKAQKNAIATPANGLLVYQTGPDSIGFHYYDLPNTVWVYINTNGFANDTTAWKLNANNNVTDTSYLGSINNKPVKFKVNDTIAGIIDSTRGNTSLGYKTLRVNTLAGFYANTAMGFGSGQSLTSGYANTLMGRHTLSLTGVSTQNIAIGDSAMGRAVSSAGNTAIGFQALKQYNGLGFFTYNTAIGYGSQTAATGTINGPFSYYNTSVGGFAMEKNIAGYENVALGVSALRNNDSSAGNVAIGINALFNHKRNGYNYNTAIGAWSMFTDSTGFWNTAIGGDALEYNKTGGVNTAIGFRSMRNHVTGGENTAVGVGTLEADSSGSYNTAVGRSALFLNKAAARNTVVGAEAGVFNNYLQTNALQGSENTYVGFNSGRTANIGRKNTVLGAYALEGSGTYGDQPTLDAYSRNSVVGDSAALRTYGNDNVAMGFKALNANTSGSQHVAIGSRALTNTIATYPNTAVGYSSLDSNTTGGANTAVGSYSLTANKTGVNNVAVGNAAMFESTAGNNNVAVGNDAGRFLRVSQNTAIGSAALRNDSTGSNNVAIGYSASLNDTTSRNTTMGAFALRFNKRDENLAIGYAAGNAFGFNNAAGNVLYGTENTTIGYRANQGNATGRKNTVIGYRALAMAVDNSYYVGIGSNSQDFLSFNTVIGDSSQTGAIGSRNTSVGHATLQVNGLANRNTVMGDSAMAKTVIAGENEAYGYNALKSLKNQYAAGYWNTAIGGQAMEFDTTAYATVALGFRALRNAYKSTENTAIGVGAMEFGDSSVWNVAVGRGAMFNYGKAEQNTALGTWAMSNKTEGYWNTAVGLFAMEQDSSGLMNTALGTSALRSNKRSNDNVAVGYNAGYYALGNGSDGANVLVGAYAGQGQSGLSTGIYNNAMGFHALEKFTTGYQNVAIGEYAMQNNLSGYENVAVGTQSFRANTGTAVQTVAVGSYTLSADTSIGFNTAVGAYASYVNTNGNSNTAIGSSSQASNTTGSGNTSVGQGTLFSHITGNSNTAIGNAAMVNDTTGANNTAVGASSLTNNRNGFDNTAIGRSSLINSTTGSANVAVGFRTGLNNTTGSRLTLVGDSANVSTSNLDNAAAIGYRAQVAQNNSLILGGINGVNGATADTRVGIRTTTPDSTFSVADNFLVGSSGTVQYDNSVPVMNYMFKSGSSNADRMVIAHSPAAANWGLQYQDGIDHFQFLAGGTSRVAIDLATGQVGIGVANPAKLFHVFAGTSGAVTNAASQILMEDNANSYFEMSTPAANENGILSSIPTTGIRSGIVFGANNSLQLRSGGNTNRLYIDNAGYHGFNRVPTTGATVGTLQAQNVNSSDDILGLYNSATGNRWTYWVSSGDNNLYMYYNGAGPRGNFNNATGAYTPTSDKRLKKDFTDFNYGLHTVMALQPSKYHYLDGKSTDPLSVGFMAQDVLKVYPEAVYTNIGKDGKQFYTMDYQSFSVLSIKAIQEQQQIINKQQNQIDELMKRIEKLEQK